jgi:hypothetical protein
MTRSYLESDLKILWGQAGGRCAFPNCRLELIQDETKMDPKRVIGKIAHIVADSDDGPRADPEMSEDERRREPNLILLCGTHHDIVDVQPNTYTIDDLRSWKADHLAWIRSRLATAVAALNFVELQRLTDLLVAQPAPPVAEVAPPTPAHAKLQKNNLTVAVSTRLQMGSLRFLDVEDFVARTAQADAGYGDRLRQGFQQRYDGLVADGVLGDALFEALVDWASGSSTDFDRIAAALAVVTYLFTICDLFEP